MGLFNKKSFNLNQENKICRNAKDIDNLNDITDDHETRITNLENQQLGDLNYTHTQLTPSKTWNINGVNAHNLGKVPSVVCIDTAGTKMHGCVVISLGNPLNELTITFSSAVAGEAYLN